MIYNFFIFTYNIMVNPTLTYDNEYNRRLRDILTEYDDIEASRNSPTMVTGGMRLQSHITAGDTPYDGREGTAQFSGTITGGVRRPRMIEDYLDNPPITDMRYRGRDLQGKMPSRAELMSAYKEVKGMVGSGMIGGSAKDWGRFTLDTGLKAWRLRNQFKNLTGYGAGGNRRRNTKEDAVFWRDFADNTANSMLNLGDHTKKLFGGRGKRANRKEDAVFWRDFADNTANSMLNLGDHTKKLFGGETYGGAQGGNLLRFMPKVMLYNAINNATGKHLPPAFGGAKGCGLPKKIGKKVGRAVSARGAIVSKIMQEQGLSLPLASKYVKEHGLY